MACISLREEWDGTRGPIAHRLAEASVPGMGLRPPWSARGSLSLSSALYQIPHFTLKIGWDTILKVLCVRGVWAGEGGKRGKAGLGWPVTYCILTRTSLKITTTVIYSVLKLRQLLNCPSLDAKSFSLRLVSHFLPRPVGQNRVSARVRYSPKVTEPGGTEPGFQFSSAGHCPVLWSPLCQMEIWKPYVSFYIFYQPHFENRKEKTKQNKTLK